MDADFNKASALTGRVWSWLALALLVSSALILVASLTA